MAVRRFGQVIGVKADRIAEYEALHAAPWPAVLVAIVFMIIGATRYRAPFAPILVILACSLLAPRARLVPERASDEEESGAELSEPMAA